MDIHRFFRSSWLLAFSSLVFQPISIAGGCCMCETYPLNLYRWNSNIFVAKIEITESSSQGDIIDGVYKGEKTTVKAKVKIEEVIKSSKSNIRYISAEYKISSCNTPLYSGKRYLIMLGDDNRSNLVARCNIFMLDTNNRNSDNNALLTELRSIHRQCKRRMTADCLPAK